MPTGSARIQLGNSWVVEGEGDSGEDQSRDEDPDFEDYSPKPSAKPKPISQRVTRSTTRSPEPELIMPSLDASNMDGSWADATGASTRPSRSSRAAERTRDARTRRSRQPESSSSPERPIPARPAKRSFPKRTNNSQDVLDVFNNHVQAILLWSADVLGRALRILKTPISYLLAIWMLFGLVIVARNMITTSIFASLSPICRIPGTTMLNLPFCPGSDINPEYIPPVEFEQLMTVQSKFEEVLEESAGNVGLPMDMKRGEASIRDLRQLVKYSQVHSKNELVLEFDGFIDTCRIASYDLQKFNSHIGRAVDSVLATTHWTTRVLDSIQTRDSSRGAVFAYIDKLLAPFQPVRLTESVLLDQYIKHTSIVEEEISKLIGEAQAILMVLGNLEDRLEIIHGIVTRDSAHTRTKKDEILAELWTLVGGNRGRLRHMNKQLSLLQEVGVYRQSAYAHISGTIMKLQAIGAGLEDLRERVGSPEVLRDRVHVPLRVHLESIRRGVERLEEGRQAAKRVENEHIRRTLERAQIEERAALIES